MRLFLWLMAGVLLALPPGHAAPSQIWVEIHDASPGYGVEALEEILAVLEKHNIHRTVVFVIPNHAGTTPLSEYPEFTEYLKEKESRGIEIGAHGYTHEGFEFRCSKGEAQELVRRSREEFVKAGFEPRTFAPPRYLVTGEALGVLRQEYGSIYLLTKIVTPQGEIPSMTHDFTYGLPHQIVLALAKLTYLLNRKGIYRLSIHIDYADNRESQEFLEEFLTWTDQRS